MSERKINLEEICNKYIGENNYSKYVLDTMREFGKQLLELAAENAELTFVGESDSDGMDIEKQ